MNVPGSSSHGDEDVLDDSAFWICAGAPPGGCGLTFHANLTRTNGSRVRRGTASSTDGKSRFEDLGTRTSPSEARHSETASVLLCLVFLHHKSSRRAQYEQADLSVWAHGMAGRGWS